MNPDFSNLPPEDLEPKVTALLLGELDAGEEAGLREVLSRDPVLRQLHEDLAKTLGLVREAVAQPAEPAPSAVLPRMEASRREALLARLRSARSASRGDGVGAGEGGGGEPLAGAVIPVEFPGGAESSGSAGAVPTPKPTPQGGRGSWWEGSWLVLAACFAALLAMASLVLPSLAKAKSKSLTVSRLNLEREEKLRQQLGRGETWDFRMAEPAQPEIAGAEGRAVPGSGLGDSLERAEVRVQVRAGKPVAGASLTGDFGEFGARPDSVEVGRELNRAEAPPVVVNTPASVPPVPGLATPLPAPAPAPAAAAEKSESRTQPAMRPELMRRYGLVPAAPAPGSDATPVAPRSASAARGRGASPAEARGTRVAPAGPSADVLALSANEARSPEDLPSGAPEIGAPTPTVRFSDPAPMAKRKLSEAVGARDASKDKDSAVGGGLGGGGVAGETAAGAGAVVAGDHGVSVSLAVRGLVDDSVVPAPASVAPPVEAKAGSDYFAVANGGASAVDALGAKARGEAQALEVSSRDMKSGVGEAPPVVTVTLEDRVTEPEAKQEAVPVLGQSPQLGFLFRKTNRLADTALSTLAEGVEEPVGEVTELRRRSELEALRTLPASGAASVSAGRVLVQNALESLPPTRRPSPGVVPQPEVSTAENAFSTFSLNVTDVSYKLAGAALDNGALPDPGSIRSEEFVNAFQYRDPEPAPGRPLAFAWDRAQYPFAQQRDLLRLSVRTAARGREVGRPLNLVLAVDNSGSMERTDRVRTLREAMQALAGQLRPEDRVSLVSFARTARLWLDGIPGNRAQDLVQTAASLTPEGGTNLEDALRVGYETALKHFQAGGVNRVVLLTDGAANLGDVEPETLRRTVESYRRRGVALDAFGIGWEGFNDDLLESLTRNGDGRYGFVNSPEEAGPEFATQLAGALQVAANDVKVQVEFNPRRVASWRQIGYAKHQLTQEQFRDNTVDAAELGAAEAGNALYVIETLPRGEGPIGQVRARFRSPSTGLYEEHEWAVPYSGPAPSIERATPAQRLANTAAAFSEWLAGSPFAGEVTPARLLEQFSGVPAMFQPDPRPARLEAMIRQAQALSGR